MKSPLAYDHHPGALPGVLFLGGFHSSMQGNKAQYLQRYCTNRGQQFTRFDYFGHGESQGTFEEGTIERWRDDAIHILDEVCTGPQVLVGSSMGAWLATLLACQRADRVHGILGVAAAPDFTELLLLPMLSDTQKNALKRGDTVELQNDYEDIEPHRIRQALIDSGRRCRVLDAALSIQCPVRLIHGTGDKDVPWQLSERLLQAITGNDAQLCLVKGADHRFSEPAQLEQITRTLDELLHN